MGGLFGFEGAIRLKWLQWARYMVMAGVIPGQNTDASALAIMEETPWWAACRLESTSGRSAGGTRIRSL